MVVNTASSSWPRWACFLVLVACACVRVRAVAESPSPSHGGLSEVPFSLLSRIPRDAVAQLPWYSRASRPEEDQAAREELQVTSVEKDDSFKYGAGVRKWHSLVVGSTTYLVGLGSTHLTLITFRFVAPDTGSGHTYSVHQDMFPLHGTPLAGALFKHWNSGTKVLEAILVLSIEGDGNLYWYRLADRRLEVIRTWPVLKRIAHLEVFEVGQQMKLVMLTSCESKLEIAPCNASADVFEFSVGAPLDAKLSQTLTLEGEAVSAQIGAVGDEVYLALALPEPGVVKLYRYLWPSISETKGNGKYLTHGLFEFWRDLQSPRVSDAIFFHVSYKMYLAVGGAKPTVFRFVSPTSIEGCPKALQSFGFVSSWLVLPIYTYRDEVVLLAEVEHNLNSQPFKGVVTLTWASAGVFNLQHQPPCYVHGKRSTVEGVSCIIAESSELGLSGAIAVELGESSVVRVLVPKGKQPSSMYRIYTRLQPVVNPLLAEILMLEETKAKLMDDIMAQDREMEDTERLLLDALNSRGPNIIKADWVVERVDTVEIIEDEESVLIDNPGWSVADQTLDLGELDVRLNDLQGRTRSLLESLSDAAVPQNGELHLSGPLTLLGGLEVTGKSTFTSLTASTLNGESVPTLLRDVVRLDRLVRIGGTKTMTNLSVVDVDFKVINNVAKDEIVFNVPGETIRVHGNLEITQLLHVNGDVELPPSGTVGGIDISEEVYVPGKEFKGIVRFDEVTIDGNLDVNVINTVQMTPHNLQSIVSGVGSLGQNLTFDELKVGGQLQVERLNGFLWSDFVKRIIWNDSPQRIDGTTTINGVLTSMGLAMSHLNDLDFPNDFVLRTRNNQHITGKKTIQNQLLVGSIDVTKTVDSVPVEKLVTLRTDQRLDGTLKLEKADIGGDVKVDWAVNGVRLNQMHSKGPLVGPGVVVSSSVAFSHLEVQGPIQIVSTINSQNFKDELLDILVVPPNSTGTVVIRGKKIVRGNVKVEGVGITVESGKLNDRKIANIAQLDATQIFKGVNTISKAVFENLHLTGRWDGEDIVALNADAVRLNGVQNISADLTFTYPAELYASSLVILDQINKHHASGLISDTICESSTVTKCVINGPINASVIRVAGNILVDGKVCGWKLDDFEQRRLSRSRSQTIRGELSFDKLSIKDQGTVLSLNNFSTSTIAVAQTPIMSDYNLPQLVFGGIAIDELYIDGNIYTSLGVNSLNLPLISTNAVKLNQKNKFLGSLIFEDVLTVGSLEVGGPISQYNLAFLTTDAVLKNELHSVKISGRKTFVGDIIVDGNIQTGNLNGLDPLKIITRFSPATIAGPLQVLGSVYAGNVNLSGLLNLMPISSFQNRYKLLPNGHHVLRGNAHLLAGVVADDLFVMDSVNGTKLEDFFKSVVMKDESARITGARHFLNKVVFENVDVSGQVNDLILSDLANDMVIHNSETPITIFGRVTFSDSLTTKAGVSLSGNLIAPVLDGCLVKEWIDNAIYLNKPMQVHGVKAFSAMSSLSDLQLSQLNAVDLSKVITLHSPQDISSNMNILTAALRHNLQVDGKVNGKILLTEYNNTLMVTGDQVVTGLKMFMNGLTVKNNVQLKGLISGRNISNVVTLQADQVITGPLKFSNMVIAGELRAGLISNINVQKWQEKAFLQDSPHLQNVTGMWDVKGQVKYTKSAGGNGLLDGENVIELAGYVYKAREDTRRTQQDIQADWELLCHDTDALLEKARAQPFLFQQLEVVQAIQSSQAIASMHAFEALDRQFLAISFANNCSGAMYHWNRSGTAWELNDGSVQNIGNVERWATLRSDGSTYLVTSASAQNGCPYSGGNIWRFESARSSVQLRNVHSVDVWHDAEANEETGHLHLLGRSGLSTWHVEDGTAKQVNTVPLTDTDQAQFVPRSAGLGLSLSDGKSLTKIEQAADNTTLGSISRSANSNLPARDQGNLVTMKIADGRKLVAVSAEASNMLVVYEDVATGRSLASIQVHGARSLSVMELTAPGRSGQTLLAFIENERILRVVQYKGVEGFVDVTKAKLAVPIKEMIPVRLLARVLVNPRHFLLLRSDHQVLLIEVEMTGDPLDEPSLNCSLP